MRRRGCLISLIVFVVLLGVMGVVGDVVLEQIAEHRLAEEVDRRVPGVDGVDASIDSFPFLGRLIARSEVRRVTITADKYDIEGFVFSEMKVVANDVLLDTSAALQGRVDVEDFGDATASATMSEDEVNRRLPSGFHVDLGERQAQVSAPAGVRAELVPGNGSLILRTVGGQRLFALPFPRLQLLPCRPEIAIKTDGVALTCVFDQIPAELKEVFQ